MVFISDLHMKVKNQGNKMNETAIFKIINLKSPLRHKNIYNHKLKRIYLVKYLDSIKNNIYNVIMQNQLH